MACKDKCCCPVKRRPAKKRKSTVGKVSATQLLAQSIASLALPRRVNEPFLYGNSALGEAQRFYKPEPLVGAAVAVAPNAPLPPVPKPAKYSRQQIQPSTLLTNVAMSEPAGRFSERTKDFSNIGKTSEIVKPVENVNKPLQEGRKSFTPASEVVSRPFNVEQISSALTPNYLPGTVLPRASIEVPPMSMPLNNKMLNELSTRQRFPNPSTTNTFSGNLPAPVNINLTEGGKGRKIAGLKGVAGYKELEDFEFSNAGRPKKVDIGRAII